MPRTRYASLLDDPAFVAHLDGLEVTGPPAPERPADQWFVESPAPRWRTPSEATWLGIVGFFVMMGLGGAAAAWVFADRVVLILAKM